MNGSRAQFRSEQHHVAIGMGAAVAATIALPLILVWLQPFAVPDLATPAARLAYAIRWEGPVFGCLGATIANVARLRFFSATDMGGSARLGASPEILQANAVLQNTLEQVIFAFGSHCVLAVVLPGRWTVVLLGLVGLFCTGRILFWLGYRHGAAARAFGFGLTFYPSVAACLFAIALLFI